MNSNKPNSYIPLRVAKQQLQETYVRTLGKESLLHHLERAIANVRDVPLDTLVGKSKGNAKKSQAYIRYISNLIAVLIIACGGGVSMAAVTWCIDQIPYVGAFFPVLAKRWASCQSTDSIVGMAEIASRAVVSKSTSLQSCSDMLVSMENITIGLNAIIGGSIFGIFDMNLKTLTDKVEQLLTCGKVIPTVDDEHIDIRDSYRDEDELDGVHESQDKGVSGGARMAGYPRRKRQSKRKVRK